MNPHPEGASEALLELIEDGRPAFEEAGHEVGLFVCAYAHAQAEHMVGRDDVAARGFDQGRALAQRLGLPHLEARLLEWCISSRADGTLPADEFLVWLDTVPAHGRSTTTFIACQAFAYAMLGEGDRARDILRSLCRDLEDRGATMGVAVVSGMVIPQVELYLGDFERAVDAGTRGCDLFDQMGERALHATGAAFVADALYRLDRLDEAETWTARAMDLSASDDARAQVQWRLVRAKVLARRGAHEEAEAIVEAALAMASELQHLNAKADAHADLAEVLSLEGRTEEARAARIRALELSRRKGNRPMAERLEAMLASS